MMPPDSSSYPRSPRRCSVSPLPGLLDPFAEGPHHQCLSQGAPTQNSHSRRSADNLHKKGRHKMARVTSIACAILIAFSAIGWTETISFNFDDGTLQGWTKEEPFNGSLLVAPVGNPGHAMAATDTAAAGGGLFARAPERFSGDLSNLVEISWDVFVPDYGQHTKVSTSARLRSANGTVYRSDNNLGDLGYDIIQAFEMLDVHGGINIDPGI